MHMFVEGLIWEVLIKTFLGVQYFTILSWALPSQSGHQSRGNTSCLFSTLGWLNPGPPGPPFMLISCPAFSTWKIHYFSSLFSGQILWFALVVPKYALTYANTRLRTPSACCHHAVCWLLFHMQIQGSTLSKLHVMTCLSSKTASRHVTATMAIVCHLICTISGK